MNMIKYTLVILATCLLVNSGQTGTITLVGNGAGGGPIFVTSTSANIAIGTRVRVGTFNNESALTTAINNFLSGSADYTTTFNSLNSNFADLGTGATNFGSSSQSAVGGAAFSPSSSQFGLNGITALTVNGVSGNYNTFNGTITNVNYSLSIGASKNLYLWTAFNNELAIVRNADGTGTSSWITPTSDLSGVTMNLSGLQSSGAMQNAEVLLGTVLDYGSGSDLIRLAPAIPEPSIMSLSLAGLCLVLKRKRKVNRIGWRN